MIDRDHPGHHFRPLLLVSMYLLFFNYNMIGRVIMIELLDKEVLGKLRPDTVSFLIKYAITEVSQENVNNLTERLSNEMLCFKLDCYFELFVDYDKESEVMLSVIIFYPASKWPEDKHDQERIMNEYANKISQIYEKILESGL